MRTGKALALCAAFFALSTASAEGAPSKPLTTLEVCNEFWGSFLIAVDGGRIWPLRAGACVKVPVPAGQHAIFPQAVAISHRWFREGVYLVEVPPEGARAVFGERNALAEVVRVERGRAIAFETPASPPPGEPFFSTSIVGVPGINGLFWCSGAPMNMADLLADRTTPFFVPQGYWSPLAVGVGDVGSMGLYTLSGDPYCAPVWRRDPMSFAWNTPRMPAGAAMRPLVVTALPSDKALRLRARLVAITQLQEAKLQRPSAERQSRLPAGARVSAAASAASADKLGAAAKPSLGPRARGKVIRTARPGVRLVRIPSAGRSSAAKRR